MEADRGQYGGVSGNCLDGASATSGHVDENLTKFTGFEKSEAGSVSITGVLEIHELV